MGGICWTEGWLTSRARWRRTAQKPHHTIQNRHTLNICELFVSGISHLICLDHSWSRLQKRKLQKKEGQVSVLLKSHGINYAGKSYRELNCIPQKICWSPDCHYMWTCLYLGEKMVCADVFKLRWGHADLRCLQRLEAGFRFPAGDWSQRQWGYWILATRPPGSQEQLPLTRPWPTGSVEMNSHKAMESSKTSKVFIRRKNSTCEQTRGWVQRESCPHDCLNHLYGAFPPGLLWPIILLCLVLS